MPNFHTRTLNENAMSGIRVRRLSSSSPIRGTLGSIKIVVLLEGSLSKARIKPTQRVDHCGSPVSGLTNFRDGCSVLPSQSLLWIGIGGLMDNRDPIYCGTRATPSRHRLKLHNCNNRREPIARTPKKNRNTTTVILYPGCHGVSPPTS